MKHIIINKKSYQNETIKQLNCFRKIRLIGIDIDNTLTNETCWTVEDCLKATPKQDVIDKVNELYGSNCIIIYTARVEELRTATEYWLKAHKVHYNALRMDKLSCDVLLDDRTVNSLEELNKWLK